MKNSKSLSKQFKNINLLDHALTHRSWVNEHPKKRTSNERLEFLGDAILEFVVSDKLFEEFPQKEEGYLTALRANLVNTINLSTVARKLDIGKSLHLSKGEEDGGGRDNNSLLADTIEAIIGALYIDGGMKSAKKFIDENILIDLKEKTNQPLKDAKSRLQEEVQAKGFSAPNYHVVSESGPDHDKMFTIEVVVDGESKAKAKGRSKNEAEQKAAEKALDKVKS